MTFASLEKTTFTLQVSDKSVVRLAIFKLVPYLPNVIFAGRMPNMLISENQTD